MCDVRDDRREFIHSYGGEDRSGVADGIEADGRKIAEEAFANVEAEDRILFMDLCVWAEADCPFERALMFSAAEEELARLMDETHKGAA